MKKIFITIFILISYNVYANFDLDISYGLANNAQLAGRDLSAGSYEINLEYLAQDYDFASVGAGISFFSIKDYSDYATFGSHPLYSIIPIYGIFKYTFIPDGTIEPYFKGKLGFGISIKDVNVNEGSVENGVYYSLGLGAKFYDYFLELSFAKNDGSFIYVDKNNESMAYNRVVFSIGYNLKFITTGEKTLYDKQKEYIAPKSTRNNYDSIETFDKDGNIIEKEGDIKRLEDFKIIN
ncbi:hypothetical protein EV215_0038 [Hypnocyclicus thermotrophus]|uniref:Outer membrane protein beta-barrel domain-containing protein n=1 Tax=Hypnocyclicus thermotrophus TaxID=1627895 RepID=A0AA46I699_9FUSO|nr:hypothetical protein [Hypnocyclicus thermotrophus]TDT72250.1 hypothetical protein EV215_0038 [Hypnocyclicus thermotrophus]